MVRWADRSAKSHTGEEQPQAPINPRGCKAALLERPWRCCCQAEQPATFPGCKEGSEHPGLLEEQLCQQAEGTPPLNTYPAQLRPPLECCAQFWHPQDGRNKAVLERVQQRAAELLKVLERVSSEERLREVGLLSLEQGQGEPHYLKAG